MQTPREVRDTAVFQAEEAPLTSSAQSGGPYRRPEVVQRRCPECHAPLAEVTHHAVSLDICPQHGTFFDCGELRTLARRINFHNVELAAQQAASERAVIAEADKIVSDWVKARTRDNPDLVRAFLATLGK